ncbi:MAG: anaerobic carbon-monoxide dehydrogenase catalytic subunit [Deltaproteobacteria bacterium]|jgi:carbon-monoxide dehydrogenase catalytic subunit|nr:anaerobic carbon-monoxide dehydrogenase catalytic subunit [Deltaproteobacteria bacterium]
MSSGSDKRPDDIAHGHSHQHEHSHDEGSAGGFDDYAQAVAAYKKSFPSKKDVIEGTPDPAVSEMLRRMEALGLETVFDRFDRQKPHCSYGMAGVCCKNCVMGPCKITKKIQKGSCGAGADLIVARNLLRMIAAGVAAHGARGREVMLGLKAAAEGRLDLPIVGAQKVMWAAERLGLETKGRKLEEVASELAGVLLEDMARTEPAPHRTLAALAPPERLKTWRELDLLPISAYHEVFEAYHRTTTGTDGDWRNVMRQFHRCALAFAWSSVMGSSIAMDSLLGLPHRSLVKVNLGALDKATVNIAVHGHSPLLVSQIVEIGRSGEMAALAKKRGAKGISFYGICCSGLSAMYRYGGVIPLANAAGAECVLATGALDLWLADVQDVFPSIMDVARCFKTVVATTSDSARLPGAEHYGYDHHHSNLSDTKKLAEKIVRRGLESFSQRREEEVHIPRYEVEGEIGFSVENIGPEAVLRLASALRSGEVLGLVNLVGCSNPRVIFEKSVVELCLELIARDVLVLTNGCASFALLKLGLCHPRAARKAGPGLRKFLGDLPPVWHMGECLDNARASTLFRALADKLGAHLKDMPLAFASPEWGNEKGLAAAASFRLLGISSYHCVQAPIQGSAAVSRFLTTETLETLGSAMVVDLDPRKLADKIVAEMRGRRERLAQARLPEDVWPKDG